MKIDAWANIEPIDWDVCLSRWANSAIREPEDIAASTGEHLLEMLTLLIGEGLDTDQTTRDLAGMLGEIFAVVSIDAFLEVVINACLLLETVMRGKIPTYPKVTDLMQSDVTDVDPTFYTWFERRHQEHPELAVLYSFMCGHLTEFVPVVVSMLMADLTIVLNQLFQQKPEEATDNTQALQLIDSVASEAVIGYLGHNEYVTYMLFDESERPSGPASGFIVYGIPGTDNSLTIRLAQLSTLEGRNA